MNCFRQMYGRAVSAAALAVMLCAGSTVQAGEIEPRSYVNTPVGVNFLLAGYAYSEGDLATVASSPLKNPRIRMHTGVAAYARAFDVWGRSGKIDVIVPYSDLSGKADVAGEKRERNVSGFNDPRIRFSVNLHGAPALTLDEFASYRQDMIIGASIQISAPLGQYDRERLVNIGNNRWFFKPEAGISQAWGDFTLELTGGAFIFTDNDKYYDGKAGNAELEQDPLYTTQLHATYNLGRHIWAALSANYDYGGRTTVNGVDRNDLQQNSRLGATLALPVNRNNSVKLYASTGLHTSIGNDYDLAGIVWQYRWGGGL